MAWCMVCRVCGTQSRIHITVVSNLFLIHLIDLPPPTPVAPQVLWAKGYTELLERLKEHTDATGQRIHVDVYGSGPDLKVGNW